MGEDNIATDFYTKSEGQKSKRVLLGITKAYDIVNCCRLAEILEKSDKVLLLCPRKKIGNDSYAFSKIFDLCKDATKILMIQKKWNEYFLFRFMVERREYKGP